MRRMALPCPPKTRKPASKAGGGSDGGVAEEHAGSQLARGPPCLQVLRAAFGDEPRGFAKGMQCVRALLGRLSDDPLPLDVEVLPLLRPMVTVQLLSLAAFLRIALPPGKWGASVRSSQVLPPLAVAMMGLCGAFREWIADGSDDVVRVSLGLGWGRR